MHWSANEVAELLETSVASVNSAVQRARASLAKLPAELLDSTVDPDHEELLSQYVDAFERYDMDALIKLLRDDAVLSMPPFALWLRGPQEVVDWMLGPGIGCRGSRLIPIAVNGTAGFGSYKLTKPGYGNRGRFR